MKYSSFELLLNKLLSNGVAIDKELLCKILKLDSFNNIVANTIIMILNDAVIKDKNKYIDLFLKFEDDYLMTVSLCKLLRNTWARKNDYYIDCILRETEVCKRDNMCRALQNENILFNEELFNFVLNQKNSEVQRRIISILDFDIGLQSLGKIKMATDETIFDVLKEIESSIIYDKKNEFEEVVKCYIDDPSYNNLIKLTQYQKSIASIISEDNESEISIKVQYVTPDTPKVLQYKD